MRAALAALVLVAGLCAGLAVSSGASSSSAGDPPLNADRRYEAAAPHAESGGGSESGDYLPPLSGSSSEITGTVVSETGAGPADFYVGVVDDRGKSHYWKGTTDSRGHFHLRLPEIAGGIATLLLFKHFDLHGHPDDGAASRITNAAAHLQNTRALTNLPASGPAIVEASSSYERGGQGQGLIPLHVRDVDPLHARVMLDGGTREVDTVASSDESVLGRLHDDTALGRHAIAVQSGNRVSNSETADVVTLRFEPIPPLHTGQVTTVRLHVEGLGSDSADVTFTVGGAALVADGSPTKTVPVRDGEADCDIRAEHAGALLVRTLLDVAIPQQVGVAPPTETPAVEATCSPTIDDGWFEPVQGVWQDDPKFEDHPTKQITRLTPPSTPPDYDAELDMISYRDTLLFGVTHYRYGDELVPAGLHSTIEMSGTTDCSDPPIPVRMRFRFLAGDARHRVIWTSGVVGRVSLTGYHRERVPWHALLVDADGVPPPSVGPFKIASFGSYKIQDQLVRLDDTPTGLAMTVHGNVHGVASLKIAYVPVILTSVSSEARALLEEQTESLGVAAGYNIPDYYPMVPHGVEGWVYDAIDLSRTNLMNPTRYRDLVQNRPLFLGEERADRLQVELQRRFDVLARESGFQRMVIVLAPHDIDMLFPEANGFAMAQKLVIVRQGRSYLTVAHEIAHTLPYLWSGPQMDEECTQPGDYHNKYVKWAYGFRIDTGNQPGPRQERDRTFSFMSNTTYPDETWIDQCTYWNLAKALRHRPDPAVMLVRGIAVEAGGKADAKLWPMYDEVGETDLSPHAALASEHWRFVLRDKQGSSLDVYPFEPPWEDENGVRHGVVAFAYQLPMVADAASLELDGPSGAIQRVLLSPQRPVLHVTTPAAGSSVRASGQSVHVAWTATAYQGRPLLATVLYSPDDRAWYPSVFESAVSSADVVVSARARTDWVKIVVTDGSRSSETTVRFTILR